ncbi:MAG TPA: BON domain-containing protein [Woeseiaceae bacterium]|nr:BON domain-containing protein [Woeseiaceae bacterium]
MTQDRTHSIAPPGAGVAALLLLPVLAAGAARPSGGERQVQAAEAPGERAVISEVQEELAGTEGLDAESITVTLEDGMVALSGEVENILAHDRAIRAAATVRGVRAIDDNLTVRPSIRSDTQIERDVATALALDPATEYWEINALVSDGFVTLQGAVESLAEKSLATRVAKSVRGVRGVENEIMIDLPLDRSDEQVAHDVTELLRWNTTVDAETIEIEVDDAIVTLSGHVDSVYEKRQAGRLAEVTGVREVDLSDLDVRWTGDDGDAGLANRTAEEVQQAVRMALSLDPRIEAFKPDIEVDEGVATLTGTVDNLEAKHVAGDAARDTLGVKAVRNQLTVEPREPIADEELEERVSNALQRSPYVSNVEIDVTAVDGEIYLEGEADSWFEHYAAGNAASRIAGVTEVHNNVDVGYGRIS